MSKYISKDLIESLGGKCIACRDSDTNELKPIAGLHTLPTVEIDTSGFFSVVSTNPACIGCPQKELTLNDLHFASFEGTSSDYTVTCTHEAACARMMLKG